MDFLVYFIVFGVIGGISYSIKEGINTGKGRLGCLSTLIGVVSTFAFISLLFDREFLNFLILIVICLILFGTTKLFPDFYSKKGISKKNKINYEKELEINTDIENLKKLLDNGMISENQFKLSVKELKNRLKKNK